MGKHRAGTNVKIVVVEDRPVIVDNVSIVLSRLEQSVIDGTQDFTTVIKQNAVLLLTNPNSLTTPVRCPDCGIVYDILPGQWAEMSLVGFEFAPCLSCMTGRRLAIEGRTDDPGEDDSGEDIDPDEDEYQEGEVERDES